MGTFNHENSLTAAHHWSSSMWPVWDSSTPFCIILPLICIVAGKIEREGQMLETLQKGTQTRAWWWTADGNREKEGCKRKFENIESSWLIEKTETRCGAGCQIGFKCFGWEGCWQSLQVIVVRLWLWISAFLLVHVINQAFCWTVVTSSFTSFSALLWKWYQY